MDTDTPQTPPAPDHGPDDPVLVRILRALAAPLATRPDAAVRHRHVAAASAAAVGAAPGRRAARGPARARWWAPSARPVLASGLALSLVAGLVAVVTVGLPDGLLTRDGDGFEIAMERGFTPSTVPFERVEDHVIVTVDAQRAAATSDRLSELLGAEPTVLSVRSDRTAFTVPASVAERLDVDGTELVADTPVTSTATPVVQSPVPSWGLDRIDAVDEPLDGRYAFSSSGAGVIVYVIDTGVRSDHADLAGRVLSGWSAIDDGRGTEDCNGHGTHVAGTVAGTAFGVAKSARIVPIRVLDCNGAGFASSVVSGISWAIANHPGGPGVINLSLGGPANSAIDRAVADAAARGLTVVAAAGNEGGDACAVSPARAAAAITVGATTSRDARAAYSNFGPCVDLFAPGSGITSAWHTGTGASATLSGTSMAAPHAAGIAARLLQVEPGAGPSRVSALMTGTAQTDTVSDPNGSPNLLLNLVDEQPAQEEEPPVEEPPAEEPPVEEPPVEEPPAEEPPVEEQPEEEPAPDDEPARDDDAQGPPASPPGLGGSMPPGFGGPVPGLERAPGLEGRTPPRTDTPPPVQPRDAPRVNGLELERVGAEVRASWRAAGPADAFVLECSLLRPGPTWRTDLTVRVLAAATVQVGDRTQVDLDVDVDAMRTCRIAAEVAGVLGVRSNTAPVPAVEEAPAVEEQAPAPAPAPAPRPTPTPQTPAPAPRPTPAPQTPAPAPGPRVETPAPRPTPAPQAPAPQAPPTTGGDQADAPGQSGSAPGQSGDAPGRRPELGPRSVGRGG